MRMNMSTRPSAVYLSAAVAFCAFAASISYAQAASERVKSACKDDYFQHRSAHALGSPGPSPMHARCGRRNSPIHASRPSLSMARLRRKTFSATNRARKRKQGSDRADPHLKECEAAETTKGSKPPPPARRLRSRASARPPTERTPPQPDKGTKLASTGKTANGKNTATTSKGAKLANRHDRQAEERGSTGKGGARPPERLPTERTGLNQQGHQARKHRHDHQREEDRNDRQEHQGCEHRQRPPTGKKVANASKATKVASTGTTANGKKTATKPARRPRSLAQARLAATSKQSTRRRPMAPARIRRLRPPEGDPASGE